MGGDEDDEGKEKGGERRVGGYVLKLGDGKEET